MRLAGGAAFDIWLAIHLVHHYQVQLRVHRFRTIAEKPKRAYTNVRVTSRKVAADFRWMDDRFDPCYPSKTGYNFAFPFANTKSPCFRVRQSGWN
jgi:hypothetical protein